MAFIVKYTQAQYNAKITELEGYQSQLEQHLNRMEGLRDNMYTFWDDPNARTAGQMLGIQIRQVRNAMDRTTDLLTFYKTAVEKLDGSNLSASSMISEAISVLEGLGI